MNAIKRVLSELFLVSYKRTLGFAFVLLLTLSLPVTLVLINQQQVTRQQAQVSTDRETDFLSCGQDSDCLCGVEKVTRACAIGNSLHIDTAKQCPDFCNGVDGKLVTKCIANKCTQVSNSISPTGSCSQLWWFDSSHLSCQQKQFCGAFMYQGLKTFKTIEECQKALPGTTPISTPIPSPGCSYKQVQCITAPCPQVIVCSTPSATSIPKTGSTTISFSVTLPGIGTGKWDNKQARNASRNATIYIYSQDGKTEIQKSSTTLAFSQGVFSGSANLSLPSGTYIVKIKLLNTLRKNLGTITAPGTFTLAKANLVSGDFNNDNVLDLKDFDIFNSCTGSKQCSQKTLTDLNDDGSVDGLDYNIFISSFSSKNGD